MHHGTCVTHVPWCMSGSLTCGDGENVPGIPGACAPAILRIWQEAHGLVYPHPPCRNNQNQVPRTGQLTTSQRLLSHTQQFMAITGSIRTPSHPPYISLQTPSKDVFQNHVGGYSIFRSLWKLTGFLKLFLHISPLCPRSEGNIYVLSTVFAAN